MFSFVICSLLIRSHPTKSSDSPKTAVPCIISPCSLKCSACVFVQKHHASVMLGRGLTCYVVFLFIVCQCNLWNADWKQILMCCYNHSVFLIYLSSLGEFNFSFLIFCTWSLSNSSFHQAGAAVFFSHDRGTRDDTEPGRIELKCVTDVSAEFFLVATGSWGREYEGTISCYFLYPSCHSFLLVLILVFSSLIESSWKCASTFDLLNRKYLGKKCLVVQ